MAGATVYGETVPYREVSRTLRCSTVVPPYSRMTISLERRICLAHSTRFCRSRDVISSVCVVVQLWQVHRLYNFMSDGVQLKPRRSANLHHYIQPHHRVLQWVETASSTVQCFEQTYATRLFPLCLGFTRLRPKCRSAQHTIDRKPQGEQHILQPRAREKATHESPQHASTE